VTTLAVLTATAGLLLVVAALVVRARDRRARLLELLELPYAEEEAEQVDHLAEQTGLLEPGIGAVGAVLERFEAGDRLATALERGRIPLRPGEVVLGTAAGAIAVAVWAAAMTGQVVLGIALAPVVPVVARVLVGARIRSRRRAIEQELPTALSLLASSLEAGHTLARAMDLLSQETSGPLAEEFAVVLAETRLGAPLTDAMDRMADRVDIEDLEWVVQAIRIQQEVGGRLSELLHTLAEYLLAREEIRREVSVLTAEGRISSWVLAALPVALALAVQVISPGYLGELFRFPGVALLGYAVASVMLGLFVTLRMVRSVEL
jgi:tight adherence protein B